MSSEAAASKFVASGTMAVVGIVPEELKSGLGARGLEGGGAGDRVLYRKKM